jgi:hypothetical protein
MKTSTINILVLSVLTLIPLSIIAWGMYSVYRSFNMPPIHLRDLDHFTAETKAAIGNEIVSVPVDHVYVYRERTLRGSTYIRFHYVNPFDFEKRKQSEMAEVRRAQENRPAYPWNPRVEHNKAYQNAKPEMQSWWIQKDQPDCEEYYTSPENFIVLDKANDVVYIYNSGG